MKKIITLIVFFVNFSLILAQFPPDDSDAVGTGGTVKHGPIDTNQIILVIAAVLLIAGVIAYKKLSIKKA